MTDNTYTPRPDLNIVNEAGPHITATDAAAQRLSRNAPTDLPHDAWHEVSTHADRLHTSIERATQTTDEHIDGDDRPT